MRKLIQKKGLDFEKLFGEFVRQGSTGTTLAAEDDKRQAVPALGAIAALLERKD